MGVPPWGAPDAVTTPRAAHTHLSDLFDLAAPLPDEGPALAGGDHEPQGDRGPAGSRAVGHGAADVLGGRGVNSGGGQRRGGLATKVTAWQRDREDDAGTGRR